MSGHAPHADAHDPFQRRVAIFMALYTVAIAFNSMLTSQARTQAILLSNQATNQWSYFQSKSTKQVLAKATRDILGHLPEGAAVEGRPTASAAMATLEAESARYEKEKDEIKAEAERIAAQGHHQEHKEHWFEYATVVAELAIVLASVALLLQSRAAFWASGAFAVASLGLSGFTLLH